MLLKLRCWKWYHKMAFSITFFVMKSTPFSRKRCMMTPKFEKTPFQHFVWGGHGYTYSQPCSEWSPPPAQIVSLVKRSYTSTPLFNWGRKKVSESPPPPPPTFSGLAGITTPTSPEPNPPGSAPGRLLNSFKKPILPLTCNINHNLFWNGALLRGRSRGQGWTQWEV